MSLILKPQEGPQTMFMATPASICIYGGAAGGGKSFGLLLSPLRYKNVSGFGCTGKRCKRIGKAQDHAA